ncbi:universal stress protein [Metabacillus litoralis]|uniref:Universal stress protein n=1 Tax=Metabacillus litoralis TaxID=152268 RepID=A0A5C6VYR9_9BACI|nr:universal stress protein [Metabacillus litoralis]TXC89758.1 universal stress protein [Metabacillus litoralis]
MFKKILLATDGSDHALRAAIKAADIAKLTSDTMITVVYVVDGTTSKSDVLSAGDKEAINEKRSRKLRPTEQLLEKENIAFKIKMLKGEPGPEIVKYANKEEFDLVIVGSRGLNALQEMVLGSVSHKVAKRVESPVMIVK